MYKPYEKRFSKKPKVSFIHRARSFSLKYFYRKIKYRIKYHTDYEAAWSLDVYSLEWLYYHLWRYLEDAGKVIDLNQQIEIYGTTCSLKKGCEVLMRTIECVLFDGPDYNSKKYAQKIEAVFNLYGKLAPYLWY